MARAESEPVETLSDFLEWASQFSDGTYVFRGVPNDEYGIQASAYRRVPENDQNSEDNGFQTFVEINTALIREARLRGYDQKDGRYFRDLEILADLQHFRAATCLIDFTYSAQVALWFACEQDSKTSDSTNGKVFAVRQDVDRFIEIEPDSLTEPLLHLLNSQEPQLYHWQPRQQNNRILAQQSIFFFGHYEFEEYAACVIQKCKKKDIQTELERVSGITEMRLFPDFEGFAGLRGDRTPYTPLSADEYTKRADRAVRRRKFEEAIADYDKAIYRKPDDAFIYYSRGLAKAGSRQYEVAIADYDIAIRLNSSDTSAYYQRGLAKKQLGEYDAAIADYDEAIQLNPNDAFIYNQRGLMKAQIGQYEEAEEDRQKSEQLASRDYDAIWEKCENDTWCLLKTLDLSDSCFDNLRGVYIIWYFDGSGNPITVKVEKGDIRDKLISDRINPQIQRYADLNLLVTWTNIPLHLLNGVEVYLSEVLQPLVRSFLPDATTSIPIILPW